MLRMIHILIWAPFAAAANPKVMMTLFVAGCIYTGTPFNFPLFMALALAFGASLPIEMRLRPFFAPNSRRGLPARTQPIAPSLVRMAVRIKGKAPRLSRIVRQLAPELRTLLNTRAGEPEAIAHQRRLASAQA